MPLGYKSGEKEGGEITIYRRLRWELKQKYQGYEVKQYNIIIDVLRGSRSQELVGRKSKGVFHNMLKAVISGTINISWTLRLQHEQ